MAIPKTHEAGNGSVPSYQPEDFPVARESSAQRTGSPSSSTPNAPDGYGDAAQDPSLQDESGVRRSGLNGERFSDLPPISADELPFAEDITYLDALTDQVQRQRLVAGRSRLPKAQAEEIALQINRRWNALAPETRSALIASESARAASAEAGAPPLRWFQQALAAVLEKRSNASHPDRAARTAKMDALAGYESRAASRVIWMTEADLQTSSSLRIEVQQEEFGLFFENLQVRDQLQRQAWFERLTPTDQVKVIDCVSGMIASRMNGTGTFFFRMSDVVDALRASGRPVGITHGAHLIPGHPFQPASERALGEIELKLGHMSVFDHFRAGALHNFAPTLYEEWMQLSDGERERHLESARAHGEDCGVGEVTIPPRSWISGRIAEMVEALSKKMVTMPQFRTMERGPRLRTAMRYLAYWQGLPAEERSRAADPRVKVGHQLSIPTEAFIAEQAFRDRAILQPGLVEFQPRTADAPAKELIEIPVNPDGRIIRVEQVRAQLAALPGWANYEAERQNLFVEAVHQELQFRASVGDDVIVKLRVPEIQDAIKRYMASRSDAMVPRTRDAVSARREPSAEFFLETRDGRPVIDASQVRLSIGLMDSRRWLNLPESVRELEVKAVMEEVGRQHQGGRSPLVRITPRTLRNAVIRYEQAHPEEARTVEEAFGRTRIGSAVWDGAGMRLYVGTDANAPQINREMIRWELGRLMPQIWEGMQSAMQEAVIDATAARIERMAREGKTMANRPALERARTSQQRAYEAFIRAQEEAAVAEERAQLAEQRAESAVQKNAPNRLSARSGARRARQEAMAARRRFDAASGVYRERSRFLTRVENGTASTARSPYVELSVGDIREAVRTHAAEKPAEAAVQAAAREVASTERAIELDVGGDAAHPQIDRAEVERGLAKMSPEGWKQLTEDSKRIAVDVVMDLAAKSKAEGGRVHLTDAQIREAVVNFQTRSAIRSEVRGEAPAAAERAHAAEMSASEGTAATPAGPFARMARVLDIYRQLRSLRIMDPEVFRQMPKQIKVAMAHTGLAPAAFVSDKAVDARVARNLSTDQLLRIAAAVEAGAEIPAEIGIKYVDGAGNFISDPNPGERVLLGGIGEIDVGRTLDPAAHRESLPETYRQVSKTLVEIGVAPECVDVWAKNLTLNLYTMTDAQLDTLAQRYPQGLGDFFKALGVLDGPPKRDTISAIETTAQDAASPERAISESVPRMELTETGRRAKAEALRIMEEHPEYQGEENRARREAIAQEFGEMVTRDPLLMPERMNPAIIQQVERQMREARASRTGAERAIPLVGGRPVERRGSADVEARIARAEAVAVKGNRVVEARRVETRGRTEGTRR